MICHDCTYDALIAEAVELCTKHASVDRLIEALEAMTDIADDNATLKERPRVNRTRALLDELKEAK